MNTSITVKTLSLDDWRRGTIVRVTQTKDNKRQPMMETKALVQNTDAKSFKHKDIIDLD